jgi:hypothetical protein
MYSRGALTGKQANGLRFEEVGSNHDQFGMIAFGAVEQAMLKPGWTRRYTHQFYLHLTVRAAGALKGGQRMMGFRHARAPVWAGALPNSLSPITAIADGDAEPIDRSVFGSRQTSIRPRGLETFPGCNQNQDAPTRPFPRSLKEICSAK